MIATRRMLEIEGELFLVGRHVYILREKNK